MDALRTVGTRTAALSPDPITQLATSTVPWTSIVISTRPRRQAEPFCGMPLPPLDVSGDTLVEENLDANRLPTDQTEDALGELLWLEVEG
jgi:predicted HAD superfamily phosphohydrolase